MTQSRISIARLILVPVGIVIALGLGALLLGTGELLDDLEETAQTRGVRELGALIDTSVDLTKREFATASEILASDAELRDALRAGDRAALTARCQWIYESLRERGEVTHFYFHGPERHVVLRLHRPEGFGDLVDRWSIVEAEQTLDVAAGLELGPVGHFTLRSVRPVVEDGEVLGYIELGREIESILDGVRGELGLRIDVEIRKEYLDRDTWESGQTMLGRPSRWDESSDYVPLAAEPTTTDDDTVRNIVLLDVFDRPVARLVTGFDFSTERDSVTRSIMTKVGGLLVLIAIVVASLVQRTRKAQRQLDRALAAEQAIHADLEARVRERTDALQSQIEEREAIESRLQHVQRIEALGRLTGGVAHDFNNLFTVIVGQLELLRLEDPRIGDEIEPVVDAVERGTRLTRQLLAVSRRQVLEPQVTDVAALVRDVGDLLPRTLGERVHLVVRADEEGCRSFIDPTQLQTALINLAVNARDAMPDGGRLEVSVTTADAPPAADGDEANGRCVLVTVRDEGEGMSPDVLEHCLDPFYTTKEVGDGTGLGLSMVHGFLGQSGGSMTIDSELEGGTTVVLRLPLAGPRPNESTPVEHGDGSAAVDRPLSVLVVEDDVLVRAAVVGMLERMGHAVVDVESAEEALDRTPREAVPFDLLFTDVGLGGAMDGVELAEVFAERWPATAILLTTGYAGRGRGGDELELGFPVLEKPYRFADLRDRIKELRLTTARSA